MAEFEAELRLNADHAGANAELGTILLNQQQAAKAIPHLEKALQANPDQWATYRDLGKAYTCRKIFPRQKPHCNRPFATIPKARPITS